jgi:hypothetical protein
VQVFHTHLKNDEQSKPDRLKSSLKYGLNERGRRLVWFRTLAFQANDPGFESRRPHQRASLADVSTSQMLYSTVANLKTVEMKPVAIFTVLLILTAAFVILDFPVTKADGDIVILSNTIFQVYGYAPFSVEKGDYCVAGEVHTDEKSDNLEICESYFWKDKRNALTQVNRGSILLLLDYLSCRKFLVRFCVSLLGFCSGQNNPKRFTLFYDIHVEVFA